MFRFALVLVVAALVGACAVLPATTLFSASGFELSGRVAVHYGNEGVSGRIFWRHSNDSDDLLITSPLGQGVARISRSGGEARLVTGEGAEYRAADAESLTERVLGWRLPLAGLPDWVQGRASPGRPAELRRNGAGRLVDLRQDDWRIEFQEYEGERPSRLRLSRENLEIRLVID
ncbi:MAG: lipoprotein insertase outer membrane protein LolB [Burkholderiales bacterium]